MKKPANLEVRLRNKIVSQGLSVFVCIANVQINAKTLGSLGKYGCLKWPLQRVIKKKKTTH